jgi:hypothetical protein
MKPRPVPPAQPHGSLQQVFADVWMVTGTLALPGPLPIRFSRNMTVVREGGRLVLINSVRLSDDGMVALEALGKVTDVVRLAGFHGMDDAFFRERCGARLWAMKNQPYLAGLPGRGEPYLQPDEEVSEGSRLPLEGARVHLFHTTPEEAVLLLPYAGGTLVSGDVLQNWQAPDAWFSPLARVGMRALGFIRPYNLGPAWLRAAKPSVERIRALLDLPFENVLPAHGAAVLGGAREKFRPALERFTG